MIETLNQKLGLQTRTLNNYEQLLNVGQLNNSFSKELTYSKENTLDQESHFQDIRYERNKEKDKILKSLNKKIKTFIQKINVFDLNYF